MTEVRTAAAAGEAMATTWGSMWNTNEAMSSGPIPAGVSRTGM